MKKLSLLLVLAVVMGSCSVDDDGPVMRQVLAEVVSADLPASFTEGKTYEIEVKYKLPSACHSPLGIQVERKGQTGEERYQVYIAGVAQYDARLDECTEESDDLEADSTFKIKIEDEDEDYTFYLWTGVDDEGESIFTEVEVPIGPLSPEEPEQE